MEKIKGVILTGFLGSGKTTLLRHLLSMEEDLSRVAVVLNDFGRIGIDGQLLESPGLEVVEMGSGCICCTLQIDLQSTLLKLIENFSPQLIFIEASGIADPAAIKTAINSDPLNNYLELSKVIAVLEADSWEAREVFGNVFSAQLKAADTILFNKVDELSSEEVSQCLKEVNEFYPDQAVIPTVYCQVEPDIMHLGNAAASALADTENEVHTHLSDKPFFSIPEYADEQLSSKGFSTFSYSEEAVFDKDLFLQFLQNLPWEIFRVKGVVCFSGQVEILNFVGGKVGWEPSRKDSRETKLVFIGWGNIDEQKILEQLSNCKAL